MLPRTRFAAVVASLLLMFVLADAGHATPFASTDGPRSGPARLQVASFWAQPYPYGYRYRKTPCVRYVPACVRQFPLPTCEVRWQRVLVCR